MYLCRCECGNYIELDTNALGRAIRTNRNISCGCYKKKQNEIFSQLGKETLKEKVLIDGTNLSRIKSDKLSKDNTSGITGVYQRKNSDFWEVSIGFKGRLIYLGKFKDKEDAIKARKQAEQKYYKPIIEKYLDNN